MSDQRSGKGNGMRKMMRSGRMQRRKVDEFAQLGIKPDYKDVERLRRYITPNGKIMPRRRTGLNAKTQRHLTTAIKRARFMVLLPYVQHDGERGRR
jgi:small subunit ribosomal protein S18